MLLTSDPAGSSVLVGALRWLEGTLLGTVATVVAVIAIASVGFLMLTRPQMFAGVTYSWFTMNAVLATELFLLFRSSWVVALALAVHLAGVLLAIRELRFFDLWLVKAGRCPRVR